jgi:hypothetical protein
LSTEKKTDQPDRRRRGRHRLIETMEESKKADHSVTAGIVALTAIVFVLDVLTPEGIAIWALYLLPLGFTRWSSVEHVVFIVAGACTALIMLGSVYSPPGASVEVAMMNRMLGVLMVWISAVFLRPERM